MVPSLGGALRLVQLGSESLRTLVEIPEVTLEEVVPQMVFEFIADLVLSFLVPSWEGPSERTTHRWVKCMYVC